MKLSDIFSLNLNSKGGAKLFKKIANKYNLDYKQVRKSVEENTNKYGYYDISLWIRTIPAEEGAFKPIAENFLLAVNNIEVTGIFLIHYTAGICAFSKTNMAIVMSISNIEYQIDNHNAKVYIKVDENDMKMTCIDINENAIKVDYKGSIIDRIVQQGESKEEVEQMFIKITEEEYERYVTEVNEQIGI